MAAGYWTRTTQFLVLQQVQQAGIRVHELDHQRHHARERFGEPNLADHIAADLLQESELLLRAGELCFQFSCAGHRLYYDRYLIFTTRSPCFYFGWPISTDLIP